MRGGGIQRPKCQNMINFLRKSPHIHSSSGPLRQPQSLRRCLFFQNCNTGNSKLDWDLATPMEPLTSSLLVVHTFNTKTVRRKGLLLDQVLFIHHIHPIPIHLSFLVYVMVVMMAVRKTKLITFHFSSRTGFESREMRKENGKKKREKVT